MDGSYFESGGALISIFLLIQNRYTFLKTLNLELASKQNPSQQYSAFHSQGRQSGLADASVGGCLGSVSMAAVLFLAFFPSVIH